MKANELMIGDYIRIVDDYTDRSFVSQVEAIDELGKVFCKYPEDTVAYPCSGDCCEPIHHTPEILEKNGFGYKEEDIICTHYYLGNPHFVADSALHIGTRDNVFWLNYCNNSIYNIRFVHELQHALRICGIDKEITI